MLTFDAPSHTYYWGGTMVPNVTRVLKPLTDLSLIPPLVLERARQEGEAIHGMVKLYSRADLDEDRLPDWLRPRLSAYKCFLQETGFTVLASEERVYHPFLRYAGTLDLRGRLCEAQAVIDIKRSLFSKWVIGLQTAAYQHAANEALPSELWVRDRYALQLSGNGGYKLEPFRNPNDASRFIAELHKWRQKHGNDGSHAAPATVSSEHHDNRGGPAARAPV